MDRLASGVSEHGSGVIPVPAATKGGERLAIVETESDFPFAPAKKLMDGDDAWVVVCGDEAVESDYAFVTK